MEKKTIGAFIAAIRKANGLTQQMVADRLNVSNKAVSRWERDECAPDISLIPALAELFEVTCDELLKGERILDAQQSEKNEPKIDKQLKTLILREISGFNTMIWIALALAFMGMVGMLCITYGLYRPVIGFCIFSIFEVTAAVITVIAVGKMKDTKNNTDIFECISDELKKRFSSVLGCSAYTVIATLASAISLSVPLLSVTGDGTVLSWDTYISFFVLPIALALTSVILITYRPCTVLLSGQPLKRFENGISRSGKMSLLQLCSLLISAILLMIEPYFITFIEPNRVYDAIAIAIIVFIALDAVFFTVYMLRFKSERAELFLSGLRNLLLIFPVILLGGLHNVGFFNANSTEQIAIEAQRYDLWDMNYLRYSIISFFGIIILFQVLENVRKGRKRNKSIIN